MEEKFNYSKTYRFELSEVETQCDTLIYVLHGYGQQAKYFIRKFQPIFGEFLVVAPEGMHRFYLEGPSGRVGASWMTKEAREDDIEDNINWLNALDAQLSEHFKCSRKLLLGFSQGGATAARWFHRGAPKFDALILWACVFPPDLEAHEELAHGANQHFVIGSEDQFYNSEQQDALALFYEGKGFKIHRFEGNHDIHAPTLNEILSEINATT